MKLKPTLTPFRHWLAAASIAVVAMVLPHSASAASSDPIAYWLGIGTGTTAAEHIAAGNLVLKQTGPSVQTTLTQNQLLDATQKALFSLDSTYVNDSGVPQKSTASAIVIFMMKRLPAYAPLLGQWGAQAALSDPGDVAPLKYTDNASRVSDAQKIASQAMAIGLKSYPTGTQNSSFTGVVITKLDSGATAISSQVVQGAINSGSDSLGAQNPTISNLSYSLVKAAAKIAKTNPLTVGSTVVGLTAQYAGIAEDLVNATVQGIVMGAAKGAKKYHNDIAQGAGYALFAVYQQTGGSYAAPGKTVAETYYDANKDAIYVAILNAGLRPSFSLQEQIYNAFLTGIGTANTQLITYGADALDSDGGGFFAYNNGSGTPVTNVQDL